MTARVCRADYFYEERLPVVAGTCWFTQATTRRRQGDCDHQPAWAERTGCLGTLYLMNLSVPGDRGFPDSGQIGEKTDSIATLSKSSSDSTLDWAKRASRSANVWRRGQGRLPRRPDRLDRASRAPRRMDAPGPDSHGPWIRHRASPPHAQREVRLLPLRQERPTISGRVASVHVQTERQRHPADRQGTPIEELHIRRHGHRLQSLFPQPPRGFDYISLTYVYYSSIVSRAYPFVCKTGKAQ